MTRGRNPGTAAPSTARAADGWDASVTAETRTRMRDLVAVAAPSWAGEAEIVCSYFATRRTVERDVAWLAAQAWKETRLVRALPAEARSGSLAAGTVEAHPEAVSEVKFAEEVKHFHLLVGLIEMITGARVGIEDLRELPEESRLQALRAPYRAGTPLERAVVDFTEGGGGAIYQVLGGVDGGPLERRMAAVFREIHDDEVFHGPAVIHSIAALARGPDDWSHAADLVGRIGHQRLRMRNEMFSFPLSETRRDEIAAGHIKPWPFPLAL
jgi:hypothetical protein